MCHLQTSICDKQIEKEQAIKDLKYRDLPLCREIERQWKLWSSVQAVHLKRLDKIESLHGFSGIRGTSKAIHKMSTWVNYEEYNNLQNETSNEDIDDVNILVSEEGEDVVIDDENEQEDLDGMVNFMASIE